MFLDFKQDQWLDTAVSGIRFHLDRKRVRRELEGHLEDKKADLRRIFPDIPEAEAQSRALAAMGDPEELKTALSKVHKPWLGWLWQASQWVMPLLMFASLVLSSNCRGIDCSIWGRNGGRVYHQIKDGDAAQVGGYTFQITGAAFLDRPEGEDHIQLALRASSPRFWERVDGDAVLAGLTATGPDGARYRMSGQGTARWVGDEAEPRETVRCPSWLLHRWGVGWKEFLIYIPAEGWTPGDRASLELESGVGGFVLSVPVEEKVRVE